MAPMAWAKLPVEKSLTTRTPYSRSFLAATACRLPTSTSPGRASATTRAQAFRLFSPMRRQRSTASTNPPASQKGSSHTPSSRQSQAAASPAPASSSQGRLLRHRPAARRA